MATLTLTRAGVRGSPLHDAIGERHSNRGPYRSTPVANSVLTDLGDLAADLPGLGVRSFTSVTDKAALGALMVAASRAFIADRQQSEEAFSWFRNNRDDVDRHRDGPTLDAQGLPPLKLALAKLLPASGRTAGDNFWVEQTRTVHTATAAAYGVITVANTDDVTSRLVGGRLLQRIHLAVTARGLALQHMNQITERVDREQTTDVPATFGPRLQALLGEPGRSALVAFRLGHPVRAGLRSPRRSLSAVTR